ncbi:MAG: hypothetical protein ACHQ51_06765 [Elusimicrobiota bacterium]
MAKKVTKSAVMLDGAKSPHGDSARVARSRPALRIECPCEGETISRPAFTFHIAAMSGAQGVDVSIDAGEWLPCREALGLWWYDWSGYESGAHVLLARTRMADGVAAVSSPREFFVG